MPKETVKQRKEREKAERLALLQANERQEGELQEDKARQMQELNEKLERDDIMIEFYQRLIHPTARLMIPYTAYGEIRQKMQRDGDLNAERVLAMQKEMYAQQQYHASLQHEFVHLRTENRMLASKVASTMEDISTYVDNALTRCVEEIEGSILKQRDDAKDVIRHLHKTLEESKQAAKALGNEAHAAAAKATALVQENTSMHTRIPRRIHSKLDTMEKDDLLMILDTLSFEDVVLQNILLRFPPGLDDPFNDPTQ